MFAGCLVALVTPMDAQGEVDWEALARLLDWHLMQGCDGLVVLGTTGEAATLDWDEQTQLVSFVVAHIGSRVPVIAGAGTQSTATTIERVAQVKALGVDAAMVVTPFYNKPTQDGLYRHYEAVNQAVDLPILLYNVPARTGVDLLPTTVARLATLANVVGIKEAAADQKKIHSLVAIPDLLVFSGDDSSCCASLLHGADGVVSVTANVVPQLMREMVACAVAGKAHKANEINARLANLYEALFVESNPMPVKWALSAMALIQTGIRLPLTVLSEPFRDQLRRQLDALALLEVV